MIIDNKKQFIFKAILVLLAIVAGVRLILSNYEWQQNDDRIPTVASGKYVVFCEEMSNTMKIEKIDTTEQYIYYLYRGLDVVAVYDWTGAYQYSLAFFRANNGVMDMRCEGGLLYISDRENYEYVFSGDELLYKYEPINKTNVHPMGWYMEETEPCVVVEKNTLYTTSGKIIMELPGFLYR